MGKWPHVFGFVNRMRCIRSVIRCLYACVCLCMCVIDQWLLLLFICVLSNFHFSNRKEQTKKNTFKRLIENENYFWFSYLNKSHWVYACVCLHVVCVCVSVKNVQSKINPKKETTNYNYVKQKKKNEKKIKNNDTQIVNKRQFKNDIIVMCVCICFGFCLVWFGFV